MFRDLTGLSCCKHFEHAYRANPWAAGCGYAAQDELQRWLDELCGKADALFFIWLALRIKPLGVTLDVQKPVWR